MNPIEEIDKKLEHLKNQQSQLVQQLNGTSGAIQILEMLKKDLISSTSDKKGKK